MLLNTRFGKALCNTAIWSFLLAVLGGTLLLGQGTTGTILGVVRDQSDAVLPGVNLTVKNVDTGISRSGVSGNRGEYQIQALPPGTYEITAEIAGFQTGLRKGVTLSVGQEATINFGLQVGNVGETVTVMADAPLIETTSASVSGLVDPQQMKEIPLNARSFLELVPLQAGAVFAENADNSATKGFGRKLSIVGTRYTANLFLLDGADINDAAGSAGGANGALTGVETVREFRVITNAYDSEYGHHVGGVISAITKSGTNQFHGSLFEFLRNDNLDAPRWEDNAFNGGHKPEFRRNQFGTAVGGPVLKDRTFFFGSFEGLREALGTTKTFNVPGVNIRKGIVPSTAANCSPNTGGTFNASTGCTYSVAPGIRAYLDSYPMPNVTPERADGTAQWAGAFQQATHDNFVTARVDHHLSNADSLFGRFTLDNTDRVTGAGTAFNTDELDGTRTRYITVEETHIFNPSLLSKTLVSFNRSNLNISDALGKGFTFPKSTFSTTTDAVGSITVSGFSAWGGGSTNPKKHIQNDYQFKQDFYWTKGRHSLKIGGQFERFQLNQRSDARGAGTFDFQSIPDFLQSNVALATFIRPGSDVIRGYRENLTGLYLQDDISIADRLKLNVGVRYEFISTPSEVNGKMATIRDVTPNYRYNISTDRNTDLGQPWILNPSMKNFAPRVGFAWDIFGNGKTSIRGGGGVYYDQILLDKMLTWGVRMPPYFANAFVQGSEAVIDFPNAFFTQPQLIAGTAAGGRTRAEGFQWNADQPTVYKWSFDIQQQVSRDLSVEIGYSGTRGVHLPRGPLMLNATPAEMRPFTDGTMRRFILTALPPPNPYWSWMRWSYTDGTSAYHGLRLVVNKRLSNGLQFQTSYTYSKTTDDGSNWNGSNDFQSDTRCYGEAKCHGLATYDFRHNFSTNFVYDLPGQHLKGAPGAILGGWNMAGILRFNSGSPLNIVADQARPTIGGKTTAMVNVDGPSVDLIPNGKNNPVDPQNPNQYFDVSQFTYPLFIQGATGGAFQGNLGRNVLKSPGVANLDLTFTKDTALPMLGEGKSLTFRAEVYNVSNRPNFSNPALSLFTRTGTRKSDAATITSTRPNLSSRQMQFALKFIF